MYLTHVSSPAGGARYRAVLDTMARLCADVIAAVQGYIAMWRACFWQGGGLPPSGTGTVIA
jgi:hypothetical protein